MENPDIIIIGLSERWHVNFIKKYYKCTRAPDITECNIDTLQSCTCICTTIIV